MFKGRRASINSLEATVLGVSDVVRSPENIAKAIKELLINKKLYFFVSLVFFIHA